MKCTAGRHPLLQLGRALTESAPSGQALAFPSVCRDCQAGECSLHWKLPESSIDPALGNGYSPRGDRTPRLETPSKVAKAASALRKLGSACKCLCAPVGSTRHCLRATAAVAQVAGMAAQECLTGQEHVEITLTRGSRIRRLLAPVVEETPPEPEPEDPDDDDETYWEMRDRLEIKEVTANDSWKGVVAALPATDWPCSPGSTGAPSFVSESSASDFIQDEERHDRGGHACCLARAPPMIVGRACFRVGTAAGNAAGSAAATLGSKLVRARGRGKAKGKDRQPGQRTWSLLLQSPRKRPASASRPAAFVGSVSRQTE